jgi:predicted RNA-binding Zn-ribbon protein involved in translation (DUF1610 family)
LYDKCVSCGFEGQGFEVIVNNLKGLSSNGSSNENIIKVAVSVMCPKCGYQNVISNVYSTDEEIVDKISKNKKLDSNFT